jgi:hypothetical protein
MVDDFFKMESVLEELYIGEKASYECLMIIWSNVTCGVCYNFKDTVRRIENWKIACFEKLSKANFSNEKLLNTYMAYFYLNT